MITGAKQASVRAEHLVEIPGVQRALKAGVSRILPGMDPDFDDAIQDAWVTLIRQRDMRSPVSVAFHAGRSAALEVLRRRRREPGRVPLEKVAGRVGGQDRACSPFLRRRMAQALRELPPGQRRIFVRTAIHGYPLAEVAAEAGLHPGTARSQAWKARRTLKRELADLGAA